MQLLLYILFHHEIRLTLIFIAMQNRDERLGGQFILWLPDQPS